MNVFTKSCTTFGPWSSFFLTKTNKSWKLSEACKMLKFRYSFTMEWWGSTFFPHFRSSALVSFFLIIKHRGPTNNTEKWRTYHCAHNECDTTDESDSLLESYGIIPIICGTSRARLNEFMLRSTGTHCALSARDRVLTQVCTFKIRTIILLSTRILYRNVKL